MNKLDTKTRALIIRLLVEGNSIRATTRIADVSKNTVAKLLEDAGKVCAAYHDLHVRNVKASHVQADEIWSFCYAKERNVHTAKAAPEDAGDIWTWTAMDRDSKLMISYTVGDRSAATARESMSGLPKIASLIAPVHSAGEYLRSWPLVPVGSPYCLISMA